MSLGTLSSSTRGFGLLGGASHFQNHGCFICPHAHAQPDSLAHPLQFALVTSVCFEWEVTHTLSENRHGQIVSGPTTNPLIGCFATTSDHKSRQRRCCPFHHPFEDWMICPQSQSSSCLQLIIKCTHLFLNSFDRVLNTSI